MSDLALNVTWQKILSESDIPQCRAIVAPTEWHNEIIQAMSNIILNNNNIENNPDLLVIGTLEKAPLIDACRNLIQEIALKPVNSKSRLGVVMSSDKLLLPAANSLLKLSEEPPSHAYLLFLMQNEKSFLPTLKSRSRFNVLVKNHEAIKKLPENDFEWLKCLEMKNSSVDSIISELDSWASCAVANRDFYTAQKIEKLKLAASQKNLSPAMLVDVLILILKDGFSEYFLIE